MLGLTRTKTHRRIIAEQGETFAAREASLHKVLVEKDAILNSTERNRVLADLEEGLNLIEAYQRALSILSASDLNIIRANAFLEKFNRKGDPNATYLGAQTRGKSSSRDLMGTVPDSYGAFKRPGPAEVPTPKGDEFVFDPASSKTRIEQEEEYWGAEAYGSGHIRIEAEAIDEGDEKEPGYTKANVRFVDLRAEEPPVLAAAKATTEDAAKGE